MYKLILASQSKIRTKLLQNANIPHSLLPAQIDEAQIKKSMSKADPEEVAMELARQKAEKISLKNLNSLVLGCDQVLFFEHTVFDKPRSQTEARQHLQKLRGHQHTLISAQTMYLGGKQIWKNTEKAHLKMREFSDTFLEQYLEKTGSDICSSVGGYKIEGLGAQLFDSIDGDYSTILGMPIFPLMKFLRSQKILLR